MNFISGILDQYEMQCGDSAVLPKHVQRGACMYAVQRQGLNPSAADYQAYRNMARQAAREMGQDEPQATRHDIPGARHPHHNRQIEEYVKTCLTYRMGAWGRECVTGFETTPHRIAKDIQIHERSYDARASFVMPAHVRAVLKCLGEKSTPYAPAEN